MNTNEHEWRRIMVGVGSPASWTAPALGRFDFGRHRSKSARGLAQSKTSRTFTRFMGSLHVIFGAHWDHEPRRVRSAGFRACGFGRLSSRPFLVHRTRKSGKPAGWKACATSRFMGSLISFFVAHWDQEPEIRKLFGIK